MFTCLDVFTICGQVGEIFHFGNFISEMAQSVELGRSSVNEFQAIVLLVIFFIYRILYFKVVLA